MTEDFWRKKTTRIIVISFLSTIVVIFVFGLGVFVGIQRANFSFQWAEDYHHNFAGPQQGFFGNFMNPGNEFTNSNGSFGKIITIGNQMITVKDTNNVEKNILIDSKTSIIFQRKNIKLSDLQEGDNVVIIGDPNSSGEIQAELIRVMPPMQSNTPPSTTPSQ